MAKNNDPIDRFERFLIGEKYATQKDLDETAAKIIDYLQAELEIAESAPFPEPERAAYDVFDNRVVPPAFKRKILEK